MKSYSVKARYDHQLFQLQNIEEELIIRINQRSFNMPSHTDTELCCCNVTQKALSSRSHMALKVVFQPLQSNPRTCSYISQTIGNAKALAVALRISQLQKPRGCEAIALRFLAFESNFCNA